MLYSDLIDGKKIEKSSLKNEVRETLFLLPVSPTIFFQKSRADQHGVRNQIDKERGWLHKFLSLDHITSLFVSTTQGISMGSR